MALISIHQSFHFKTANLVCKYFICFCIWRILSLPSPSQFIDLAMAKTRFVCWHYYKFKFLIQIWTIRERTTLVCNMNQDVWNALPLALRSLPRVFSQKFLQQLKTTLFGRAGVGSASE